MARVEWGVEAARSLDRLIQTHSLPADTRARVERCVRPLQRFPLLGASIEGGGGSLRFVLGPWRWMIVVYACFDEEDRVVVVSIEDGRSSRALTAAARP